MNRTVGAWPGFGNQPCYKAPGNHQIEQKLKKKKKTRINIKLLSLPPHQWPNQIAVKENSL